MTATLYRPLGMPDRYMRIALRCTVRHWRDRLVLRYGRSDETTVFLRPPAYLYRPLGRTR